jgi:hypothetical protein
LNILRKDSDRLREIFNDFAVLANEMSLDLVCFYELYPTTIKYRRGMLQYMISAKALVGLASENIHFISLTWATGS